MLKLIAVSLVAVIVTAAIVESGGAAPAGPPRETKHDPAATIDRTKAAIVLIDAQPAFWKIMWGDEEPVMERMEQLLITADVCRIPLIATFENSPEWNGWLPERLEKVFPDHGKKMVKRTFDCCSEDEFKKLAGELKGVEQIILAGAETDVCVLQSALGLRRMGYQVFLLEDCVFTNENNVKPALDRMYRAGVIPCTYKTFFFEVMRTVERKDQPQEWRERFRSHQGVFKGPYRLTRWGLKPGGEKKTGEKKTGEKKR